MTRGLGYRADPADTRDRAFAAARRAAGMLPEWVSHDEHVELLNQGPTSSCVGHAWAQALHVGMKLDGGPVIMPSPIAIYKWACAETGDEREDAGTYLRSAAKAVTKFGFPEYSDWPTDPAKILSMPPHRVYRSAFDRRGMHGYRRISMGDLDGIRRALYQGAPVVFGLTVRESFLEHTGKAVIDEDTGPIAGGHAMCLTGYGAGYFRGPNSWGPTWGDEGFFMFSEDRMKQATDIWMADFDPARGGPAVA